jgi:anti-sigma-K factor RskA|uniref:anti-sigma factor domain-containing protein n=1 Tax=Prosthecobacter sp. TaxID=1965333 RepID=UPI0037848501
MDERQEELAALNALHMLEGDEQRALDGACVSDKELRALNTELEQVALELARLITPVEPPADMKKRIRAKIRSRGGLGAFGVSRGVILGTAGWALAAGLAVASVWLWNERSKLIEQHASAVRAIATATPSSSSAEEKKEARSLEDELKSIRDDYDKKQAALNSEIESLRKREAEAQTRITQLTAETEALKKQDSEAQLQIAKLQSKVWEYRRSEMSIVWDGRRSQGVIMLEKMPLAEPGTDYQLWVVDPGKPDPVSAGVITVDDKGSAKTVFKTVVPVGESAKFALSVENKGGVPKNKGPIVFIGP